MKQPDNHIDVGAILKDFANNFIDFESKFQAGDTPEDIQAIKTATKRIEDFYRNKILTKEEVSYIKNVIELDVERSPDYSESQLEWIDDLKAKVAQLTTQFNSKGNNDE